MKKGLCLLAVFVCALATTAQVKRTRSIQPLSAPNASSASVNSTTLPIKRVILYSNGVAYIERRGIVTGNAEINLSFKQSQVDDVLKSMVVLDLGQGKIGAVSYNSSAPASARTAEIPFSVQSSSGDGGGIAAVLSQLQGAKVAVATVKGTVIGSILTVERKQLRGDAESAWTSMLVITSENGELMSFDLNTVRGVRVLDDETRKDLNEFANATASARRRDAKTITVTSNGSGQREMAVSYTIAAPIWKTTYRVVLDSDGKPFFQGWAIVDNISEEDWSNVQLSLVSGSPVSFIQNLQKPFYRYRPVVSTPQDLQLRPQLYEPQGPAASGSSSSISGVITDPNGAVIPGASISIVNNSNGQRYSINSDSNGNFSQSGLGPGNYTLTVSATGFSRTVISNAQTGAVLQIPMQVGSVSATVDVTASSVQQVAVNSSQISNLATLQRGAYNSNFATGGGAETTVSDALTAGNSGVKAAATGEEIGDLFQYTIEHPISVMRDRSALIPIVQTKMEGERVSIYNTAVRQDRPFSGVLLKNSTNLTLESGSMTVLEGNAYAGEALMERLKPKERRLISFALDLGTHVRVRDHSDREATKLIKIVDGTFQAHYFRTERKTYQLVNQTERKKVIYIEHPVRNGWLLTDDSPKPDYTTQKYHRFRIELGPFEEREISVSERQPLMDTYQLTEFSRADLDLFVERNYIDATMRTRLEKLLAIRSTLYQTGTKLDSFDDEIEGIEEDQKRLRENIEALSKTPEARSLIARYIAKANDQESRLEAIEKERKTLTSEKERLERELAVEIRSFEVK